MAISNEICKFKSPIQTCEEFENLVTILELTLEALIINRAFLTIIFRESNPKQETVV